jgi:EAL domain-containing protein (putative c-di-GMP-specific phosphodiesterase class I)
MRQAVPTETCSACRDGAPAFPFSMAFQPIVDLQERRIDGYEALVRGVTGAPAHTVLARVGPQDRYSFDQACRVRAIELAMRLGLDARLSINFMPNAVYDPRACIRLTLDAAFRTGLDCSRLTFEIVEGESLADTGHLLRIIREYRRQGFAVALDDYGTGYSSLARLADLQPDILKLDRALLAGCNADRARRAIVDSTAALCRALDVKLVAEGVETAGELAVVEAAGIRFVQGFHFARPAFERLTGLAEIAALRPHASAAEEPAPA